MGPIPWTAMIDWCEYHGMGRDTTDHLVNVVRRVDSIYIRRANAKKPTPPSARPEQTRGRASRRSR